MKRREIVLREVGVREAMGACNWIGMSSMEEIGRMTWVIDQSLPGGGDHSKKKE